MRTILIIVLLLGMAAASADDYEVSVDAKLTTLTVVASFDRPATRIAARARDAGNYLRDVSDCNRALTPRGRRLVLPASGIRCLRYTVDLSAAAAAERRNRTLAADNILVSPAAWLWRPPLDDDSHIRVRFQLDDSTSVAVPWQAVPDQADTYLLETSPESGYALAAFGHFAERTVAVDDGSLRVAMLRGRTPYSADDTAAWIADTATTVSLAYGRFPNPDATVLVIPVGDDGPQGDPVVFGRVVRDSGESVELLINAQVPGKDFAGDWTAVHEFSHLMLPYLDRDYRWISEGFAQYQQNVLLARAGHYTRQFAWQKIHDGLARGRRSVPDASPNEAASSDERNARMKVYWSGAALALMADVELRQRSNGQESLDTVLARLQACCLPSPRRWSGPEFMQQLDDLLEQPVFMPLYRRYADRSGFPPYDPLLRELGVRVSGGRVSLAQTAPLAGIRSAIMTAADTKD